MRPRFPELRFEVENYPVPPARALVGQVLSAAFFVGLAVAFLGRSLLPAAASAWLAENQTSFYVGLFVLQMVGNQLAQSGAFEVSLDGQMIFSKLEKGGIPDINWLAATIQKVVG